MQRHFSDSDCCRGIIPEFFKIYYFYATKTVNFFAEEPRARLVSSAKIGVKLGNQWEQVIPLFNFPPEIRKLIYTTNSIEALNRSIRKVIKTRTMFPTDDSVYKLVFLAIKNATKDWNKSVFRWRQAMLQFVVMFGERFKQG